MRSLKSFLKAAGRVSTSPFLIAARLGFYREEVSRQLLLKRRYVVAIDVGSSTLLGVTISDPQTSEIVK